ncbi:MAG: triose-phosphate isomerase [Patescibacteria group bacterium]
MKKIIIANWKLNPKTLAQAIKLAKASDKKGAVVAPPFVFIEEIGKILKKAALGAQDLKIPPEELKRLGVKYIIIGHSDRRALGETDAVINKKVKTALMHGFKAILCVGEKWSVRKKGIAAAKKFVASQLRKDLENSIRQPADKNQNLIIAYEPIWAIGTGRNDTPADASEMAQFIKNILIQNSKILYGGSVDAKNAKSFLEAEAINGLLVGGASLNSRDFNKIIRLIPSSKNK